MELIKEFFLDLDRGLPPAPEKVELRLIGSAALMLQAGYERGTKDSDILETSSISGPVKEKLLSLAGKGSSLHTKYGIYLDIVCEALPFLPQRPLFHPFTAIRGLKHCQLSVLDITDVVVSKLKRFNANDVTDIRAVAAKQLLKPARLSRRFRDAADCYSTDARASELPRYVRNLNTVERDFLSVPESEIELPGWL